LAIVGAFSCFGFALALVGSHRFMSALTGRPELHSNTSVIVICVMANCAFALSLVPSTVIYAAGNDRAAVLIHLLAFAVFFLVAFLGYSNEFNDVAPTAVLCAFVVLLLGRILVLLGLCSEARTWERPVARA
jgi:Na+-driven multidrug efflux pump